MELAMLKDLKRKHEGDVPFGVEDLLYYVKRVDLDFATIKQYFPAKLVLSGIFKIFQDLFGLRFEETAEPEVIYHDQLKRLGLNHLGGNIFIFFTLFGICYKQEYASIVLVSDIQFSIYGTDAIIMSL